MKAIRARVYALRIVPAYGRDYRTAPTLRQDWEAGKDFRIANHFDPDDGRYVNRADVDPATRVVARYDGLLRSVTFRAGTPARPQRLTPRVVPIANAPRVREILDVLRKHPAGMAHSRLLVSWPEITGLLRQLCDRGWIERVRLPRPPEVGKPYRADERGYRIKQAGREWLSTPLPTADH